MRKGEALAGFGTPTALSSYFARDDYSRLHDLTRLMLR